MYINKQRLWNHLIELSSIGKNPDGSITRWAFTKEDEQAARLLMQWMQEAGLKVRQDAVGNVIGILEGKNPELPPIVCGSHFDTVKNGGMFDGCLGVLAGIEALQTCIEHQYIIERTIQVIGFRDEEGNRFGYGMIGSHSICGNVDEAGLDSLDEQGISLSNAMKICNYHPELYKTCKLPSIHAYFELHIEQANILNTANKPIGIVEGIAGLERYTIKVQGKSNHAGATPMQFRKDPVEAMSFWIQKITQLACSYPHTVATIGSIHTYPGACNIICDSVEFSLDIRSLQEDIIHEIMNQMECIEKEYASQKGIIFTKTQDQYLPSLLCDEKLKNTIETCCKNYHIPYEFLASGAGHDCMNFKNVCPAAMIFVRSQNEGCSHCKEEFSTMEDCCTGCQILLDTILTEN